MDRKAHRIIGILLAAVLLFAGMYTEAFPAEDLFAYDLSGKVSAGLAPVQSDPNADAIGTAESPVLHSMNLQARARYRQHEREINAPLSFLCSKTASLSQKNSLICHLATYLFQPSQNELITEYVYQSDGKKRL